jgi:HPt (histidine-containing phosphotransfer) domain-containing protein
MNIKFLHFSLQIYFSMPHHYKYIDMGYLEEMSSGKQELIYEMIGIFIKQVPEFIEKMEASIAEENWTALGKISHKAKASAAIMGMTKLADDLKAFELMTNTKINKQDFVKKVNDFETRFQNGIKELENYILNSQKTK